MAPLFHPQDLRTQYTAKVSSGSLHPVPLSLLSSSHSVDGSEAQGASVCPRRAGFAHILPLKLSEPWLLLVRLPAGQGGWED